MTEQEEFEKEAKKMPKIDMTKIANVEALDSGTRKAITAAAESSRKVMKKKFNFQQAIPFPLPSGGKFYQDSEDEDLKNGIIKLYPLSLADEEIITNKTYLKNGTMFYNEFHCLELYCLEFCLILVWLQIMMLKNFCNLILFILCMF